MNSIHPTAVIGPQVELGRDNVIGPYAVLVGRTRLGDGNWIGPHVVLGTPAEIRAIDHGADIVASGVGTGLVLGSRNVIREHATVHQGHYATTSIGSGCYLMNRVYIGHDNVISDDVTMASGATLGGHVHVGRSANLGMGAIVHQRRVIGPGAMVGMAAVVTRDIPPHALAYGNPCRVQGVNRVGMERAGLAESVITELHRAYADGAVPPDAPAAALESAWTWWAAESQPSG